MVAHVSLRDHVAPDQTLEYMPEQMWTDKGRETHSSSGEESSTGESFRPSSSTGSDRHGEYSRISAAEEGRAANDSPQTPTSTEPLPMPIAIARGILLLLVSAIVIDLSIFILWCVTSHVSKLFGWPISDEEWNAGVRATHPLGFLLGATFNMVFYLTYSLRASEGEDVWIWWKKAMMAVLFVVGVVNISALLGGSFCAAAKAILGGHQQVE